MKYIFLPSTSIQCQYAKGKNEGHSEWEKHRSLPAGDNALNLLRCLVDRRLTYAKDYTYIGSHNAALGSNKDQTDEDS